MERHDPFAEMNRMFEQMRTRMWTPEGSFGGLERSPGDLGTSRSGGASMDLKRHDDEYVFVADLPGFEREDIDLRFADGVLTLTAETEAREETGDAAPAREGESAREGEIAVRSAVTRSRRVAERMAIPEAILEDEIAASYRNGVLEVHLPLADPVEEADDEGSIDIRD